MKTRITNTSGFAGVHQNTKSGKWISRIPHENDMAYLGSFEIKEKAVIANVFGKLLTRTV